MTLPIHAPLHETIVPGDDGVPLKVRVFGDGPIPWVIAPGLGTPYLSWKFIAERFGHAFRLYTWDSRGAFESGTPTDRNKLRVEDHTADLFAITDHFRLKKFVLGGWSLGVQISLEAYHQQPRRVRALVLINGAPGRLLSTAFGIPGFESVAVKVLRFGERLGAGSDRVMHWLLGSSWTLPLMERLQIFTANAPFFGHMVAHFRQLDFAVYSRMMWLTNEHTAVPYLPEVRVPTLITAGTKDVMTPLSVAEQMAAGIPGAELFVVPNGTHYTIAEYPEIINLRLERFFRDHLPGVKLD